MAARPAAIHPGLEKNYALDFAGAIFHVLSKLAAAQDGTGESPTLETLTQEYRHAIPSDLHRVKLHEHLDTDKEARQFLMAKAIEALGDQVVVDEGGRYALTRPATKVRYDGKRAWNPERHTEVSFTQFNDPYNPLTGGAFAINTRTLSRDANLPELRESMRAGGWLDGHPAIKDERGVVIVGHRRLQIAEELGIEPKIETKFFGTGDDADRVRSLYALLSNLGNKPLTPEDRKHWTKHLYEDEAWSQERIADALHVNQATVSRDLEIMQAHKAERRGRPRKEPRLTVEQKQEIGEERLAGASYDQLQEKHGVSSGTVTKATEYVLGIHASGRLDEQQAAAPEPPPPVVMDEEPCPCCGRTGPKPTS